MAWLEDPDSWCLYLWGATGGRKTTLAAAVLMELRRRTPSSRRRGLFLPAYTIVRKIRNLETAAKVLAEWRKEPWLVIDDLGKHRDTPYVHEQLLHLLHERYDWAKPGERTIITANMDLDTLAKRMDPATARRLEEGTVLQLQVRRHQETDDAD